MPVYDLIEIIAERIYSRWRRRLRSLVKSSQVFEVGLRIVKNLLHYRPDLRVKVIDLGPGMLERATPTQCGSDARIQMMIVTYSPDIRHYWTLPQDLLLVWRQSTRSQFSFGYASTGKSPHRTGGGSF